MENIKKITIGMLVRQTFLQPIQIKKQPFILNNCMHTMYTYVNKISFDPYEQFTKTMCM
jgi:hypothetical protein